MDEQHNSNRCELFGAGSQAKISVRIDLRRGMQVAQTVAAFKNLVAILHHQHRNAGRPRRNERREYGVYVLCHGGRVGLILRAGVCCEGGERKESSG